MDRTAVSSSERIWCGSLIRMLATARVAVRALGYDPAPMTAHKDSFPNEVVFGPAYVRDQES